MRRVLIAPGLTADEGSYEAAAAGLATHVPDLGPLTWEEFTTPGRWWLVPDDVGDCHKAEFVLIDSIERTVKINLWSAPDQVPLPHSHPWDFRAYVLLGGYSEDRFDVPDFGAVRAELGVEHVAGGVNDVPLTTYHEVTAVHEPGRTLTLMLCGEGQRGRWGYLDTATGERRPGGADPTFAERLRALNPHRR